MTNGPLRQKIKTLRALKTSRRSASLTPRGSPPWWNLSFLPAFPSDRLFRTKGWRRTTEASIPPRQLPARLAQAIKMLS